MKNSALNSIERRTEVSWTCGPRLEASRATPIRMPDAALSFHVEAPGAGAFVIQTSHAMSGPACEPSQVSLSLRDRRRDQLGMPICRFTLSNDGRGTALSLPVAERQGYHPLATAPGLDRQRVCPRPQSSLEITCEIERTEKDSMAKQKVSRPASKGATKSAKKSVVAAKKTPIVKRVVKRGDLWRATELTGDYDQHVLVETALLQKSLTSEAIQMSSTGIRPFNCCQGERQEKTYPLHRVQ